MLQLPISARGPVPCWLCPGPRQGVLEGGHEPCWGSPRAPAASPSASRAGLGPVPAVAVPLVLVHIPVPLAAGCCSQGPAGQRGPTCGGALPGAGPVLSRQGRSFPQLPDPARPRRSFLQLPAAAGSGTALGKAAPAPAAARGREARCGQGARCPRTALPPAVSHSPWPPSCPFPSTSEPRHRTPPRCTPPAHAVPPCAAPPGYRSGLRALPCPPSPTALYLTHNKRT